MRLMSRILPALHIGRSQAHAQARHLEATIERARAMLPGDPVLERQLRRVQEVVAETGRRKARA